MLKSFEPLIDGNTKQLVIGTMPGVASLKAAQYYGHPQNKFWDIAFEVFAKKQPPNIYEEKLALLLANNTGLWDSLAACLRKGSLDKDIKEEKPNNFPLLFKKYPAVKRLLFNGQKAHLFFIKYFDIPQGFEYIVLPSTSPANATINYAKKLEVWSNALNAVK